MGTSRPLPKRRRLREHFSGIQHVLLVSLLMSLAAVTIVSLVLFWPLFAPGKSTPSPTPTALVVASPVPSPLRSPTPLSTPSPTSTATSSPSPVLSPSPTLVPSPTPSPAPGVLGYPLYSGNPRLPEIALTFDDGPNVTATPQILAILQRYRVPATFFLVGQQAAHYPALVTQEAQQGVVIGNHTWSHPNLITLSPEQVRAQLESCSAEISQDAEVTPVLFRPPGGNFTVQTQAIAASLGLSTILWNVDPKDWSRPGAEVII